MFDASQEGPVEPTRTTNSREGGLFALSADQRILLQATSGGALLAWRAMPPPVLPTGTDRAGRQRRRFGDFAGWQVAGRRRR